MTTAAAPSEYGEPVSWEPDKPKFKPLRLLISWFLTAIALLVAAIILPGVNIVDRWDALWMAAVVALLNALLPPLLAALRLPFMIGLGFILILILNALVLLAASNLIDHSYEVDNFGWALLAALVVAAVSVVLSIIFGTNDDDTYTIQVTQRIARRQGGATRTNVPGIIYLEIDGLALPVLQRAMRDGSAPHMAKMADRALAPAGRVGDRPLLADRREPGRDPARLEREHPGLPLGREGEGHADGVLGAG